MKLPPQSPDPMTEDRFCSWLTTIAPTTPEGWVVTGRMVDIFRPSLHPRYLAVMLAVQEHWQEREGK